LQHSKLDFISQNCEEGKSLTTKIVANAKLIEGFQIALDDNEAHSYVVDLAPDLGTGFGASSLELCVMSHAGCYATIFLLTAKKMRLVIKGLKVNLEAVKSDETGTISEETFDISVRSDAPKDRIDHAHKLTVETCPVGILFEKAGVKATYKVTAKKE
jgi:uncharacterized OsmC-like protein